MALPFASVGAVFTALFCLVPGTVRATTCTDAAAVSTAREHVDEQCRCAAATSRAAYLSCVANAGAPSSAVRPARRAVGLEP